ncbi:Hsp20/alpha crystallin family protein [Halomonas sp. 328]|uniref:Hsp20/alpha crystallin family protein n=1 Tax=Halomonas sp. 328 TaxID=2776704 RepID=UPI0018A7210D|nr:Hsp20/alpha crystallin family protein [Halomonas sp. 328]MBF8222793.1 Hsp20/alpha crystallin family protein [Halomonas sp. 328]
MNLQKFSPWNWFKSESRGEASVAPPAPERPLPPALQLHQELDRWMDETLSRFGMPTLGQRFAEPPTLLRPSIDIREDDSAYRISIEVPGVDEQDVKLTLDERRLIVEGEKRQEQVEEEGRYRRVERSYGSFCRVLDLPEDAKAEEIQASFAKGVLTITVPRDETRPSRRRQIPIQ